MVVSEGVAGPTTEGEVIALLHGVYEVVAHVWTKVIVETHCLPIYQFSS